MPVLRTPTEAAQWLRQHVTGTLVTDSRQVQPGDGFVAWPGSAVDGRQFVPSAVQRGAAACLMEQNGSAPFETGEKQVALFAGLKESAGAIAAEFFGEPSHRLSVVAVTGTNGKTTTAWWLAQALSALPPGERKLCAVVGTLGVGRPPVPGAPDGAMTSTGMTTPDPVFLQRVLSQFAADGCAACAMEASSIGLQEHRLLGTRIHTAVFTNFTQDHLDYHGTMASYWEAKRMLFSWPGLACGVVNIDDEQGAALAQELESSAVDLWTVSSRGAARLRAENVAYAAQGLQFDVVEDGDVIPLQTRTIGSYNVNNLLGVLAAMRSLGVPLRAAVQACGALHPVPGRMEFVGQPGEPLVAVDYAHTPDALGQALTALRPLALQRGGRLWCVFGCGGDRDASKRPLMGAIAAKQADKVVVTSDNPRSEKPEAIIAQILLGLPASPALVVQADRARAILEAVNAAEARDVILLAGKGHEQTQDIAGVKYPFSDSAQAHAALRQRQLRVTEVQP